MQPIARYSLTLMLLASFGLHAAVVADVDDTNPMAGNGVESEDSAARESDRPFMAYEIWREVPDSGAFDKAGSPIRFGGAVREHARRVTFGPDRQPIRVRHGTLPPRC